MKQLAHFEISPPRFSLLFSYSIIFSLLQIYTKRYRNSAKVVLPYNEETMEEHIRKSRHYSRKDGFLISTHAECVTRFM